MAKGELHMVIPALTAAIATVTGLASPASPTVNARCALWSFAAVEAVSTPTWSVIVPYSPMGATTGANQAALQIYTQGESVEAVLQQLASIHSALLDEFAANDHDPRRAWQIGSGADRWLVDIFELEEGKIIGNVDAARIDGSLNFVLAYRRVETV